MLLFQELPGTMYDFFLVMCGFAFYPIVPYTYIHASSPARVAAFMSWWLICPFPFLVQGAASCIVFVKDFQLLEGDGKKTHKNARPTSAYNICA